MVGRLARQAQPMLSATHEEPCMRIKRILVPIDFSLDSLHALSQVRELAKVLWAELLLLHVVEPAYRADGSDVYVILPEGAVLLEEQMRAAEAHLVRIGARLKTRSHRVRICVKRGSPSKVIVDTAQGSGCDLIAMGTHGRTGLSRMLIGSVAAKVTRGASCPVLTVRRAAERRTKRGKMAGRRQA